MIIDAILDRQGGVPYTEETARYIYDQAMFWGFYDLASAFDCGTNEDCQRELAKYIDVQEYRESIKDYVYSQKWVN